MQVIANQATLSGTHSDRGGRAALASLATYLPFCESTPLEAASGPNRAELKP
ncbi:hypothetical protein SAMN04487857_102422 [Pseudomonas sp. ok272]|nr:hypothetical protein SAMN04487857_102422 [Pseudomonas sp. ok272]SFM23987.1 hypothetical protein SAMN04487858_101424 [Pseudomonas sp. ok602]